jgi:UDP-N-acetylglucosamine--N-acetylmuramyl-(pentapeptide) pyrophosphoryl-undecaprenol N-acetylglucosamine transferase
VTTLLVASTGGHLKQLHQLHQRFDGLSGPLVWATFDTPQSRSLLAGETVEFVPFVGGRDPRAVARNFQFAWRILRRHRITQIVSTGSAVALPFFLLGRARRLDCHYVESAARSEAPSMTGSMIGRIPGVNRYAQYPGWARELGWRYVGSVLDNYGAVEAGASVPEKPIRMVVFTLGTYRGYGFRRLVEKLIEILPDDCDVLWQTGETDVTGLGIEGRFAIPEGELVAAMRDADVVVAHAGVGAALASLEAGRCPVLVPRRLAREEHVDDHQIQIADELSRRGLSVSIEADDLTLSALERAASAAVCAVPDPPRFPLARRRHE